MGEMAHIGGPTIYFVGHMRGRKKSQQTGGGRTV